MRILQTIKRFDFGGAETYVRVLSNELSRAGHEVYLCSRSGGRQQKLLHPALHWIPYWRFSNLLLINILQLWYIVRKYQIQLIHAHQRMPIFAASLVGFLTAVPVIATVHGRTKYDLRSGVSKKIPQKVIYVSRRTLEGAKPFISLTNKTAFLPNIMPAIKICNCLQPFEIGYFSRINGRHSSIICGLMKLMPVLAEEFPAVRLTIYGEGAELERIQTHATEVNSLFGKPIIRLAGFMEDTCCANALPELVIGVGRVAIESALRGCSVISANKYRAGELIKPDNLQFYHDNNFVNIYGNTPDFDLLKESISSFFRNREKHRKESMAMLPDLQQMYHPELLIDKILNLYNNYME